MKRLLNYKDFINEKYSGDHAKELGIDSGQWVQIDPSEHPELSKEFFDLLKVAYTEVGGHVKIKSPKDVFSDKDWTYWKGIDIHDSPDVDLIVFGKETPFGIKTAGVGHDGKKDSRKEFLKQKAMDLSTMGYYSEVSDKLAEILLKKYKVPQVTSEAEIEKILKGKEFEFHGKHPQGNMPGDGWYSRKIGGKTHTKIMVGNPSV